MNILIADDHHLDRASIKDMITEIQPDCSILEVSSTRKLFRELSRPWDLLFLDISFSGNRDPDDDGLDALLEIVNSYPALPVCLVTGHYKEKLPKFIQQFLGTTLQVVAFLDKASYSESDLKLTVSRAQEYQSNFNKSIEDKRAFDDLLFEAAESEKRKIMASLFCELHDRLSYSDMLNKAFTGNDWESRIEGECQLAKGLCNVNAALLCIEMDRLIKSLCPNDLRDFRDYNIKIDFIADKFNIGLADRGIIKKAWRTRNKIVHAHILAERFEAHQVMTCINFLSRIIAENESIKNDMAGIPVAARYPKKPNSSKQPLGC